MTSRPAHPSVFIRCRLLVPAVALLACSQPADRANQHAITDSATGANGSYTATRVGQLSDTVIHLATGDSVELQSTGPAHVKGRPEGLMLTYHPFFPWGDSARVINTGLAVFDSLRPHFTGEPPFVVLRAIDARAADRSTNRQFRTYGLVLERRADGKWYRLHDSTPVRR